MRIVYFPLVFLFLLSAFSTVQASAYSSVTGVETTWKEERTRIVPDEDALSPLLNQTKEEKYLATVKGFKYRIEDKVGDFSSKHLNKSAQYVHEHVEGGIHFGAFAVSEAIGQASGSKHLQGFSEDMANQTNNKFDKAGRYDSDIGRLVLGSFSSATFEAPPNYTLYAGSAAAEVAPIGGVLKKLGSSAVDLTKSGADLARATAKARRLKSSSMDTPFNPLEGMYDYDLPKGTFGTGSKKAPNKNATPEASDSSFDRDSITDGFQDHHIISDKNKLTQDHELLDLAGFDLQTRQNKIFLPTEEALHPTRSIHKGRHTTQVSRNLAEQMDAVVEVGRQQGWTQKQYKDALDAIISQERGLLKSGDRALNKNQRPWAQ